MTTPTIQMPPSRQFKKPPKKLMLSLALLIMFLVASLFVYRQQQAFKKTIADNEALLASYKDVKEASQGKDSGLESATDQKKLDDEAVVLAKKVGEIVKLPQDEAPTIVTLKDKDALTKNLEFFRDAENGDKVLVYHQAGRAILYRPSIGKIINMGPLRTDTIPLPTDTPTSLTSPNPETSPFASSTPINRP